MHACCESRRRMQWNVLFRQKAFRFFISCFPTHGRNGGIIVGVLSPTNFCYPFIAPSLPGVYFTLPLITRITFTKSKGCSLAPAYLPSRASKMIFPPPPSNRNSSRAGFPFIDCCCEKFRRSGKLEQSILHRQTQFQLHRSGPDGKA